MPVFKWPEAGTVDRATRSWAKRLARRRKDIIRIGYFGSYARGERGVGSDLDVIILQDADEPFHETGLEWDVTELPVAADVLVYTEAEWRAMAQRSRPVWYTRERKCGRGLPGPETRGPGLV